MPQLLELIKKGDRHTPTVYQFGANEHLNIHRADQYADLTDAETGACIRIIGWQGLRDMGYSPAKLLDGDTTNQSLKGASLAYNMMDCIKYALIGSAVALTIAIAGGLTGCNDYVLSQIEQDVATSTIEPRLSDSEYQASKQYADAKHANDFLARANRRSYE